jgi:hypothetical protein
MSRDRLGQSASARWPGDLLHSARAMGANGKVGHVHRLNSECGPGSRRFRLVRTPTDDDGRLHPPAARQHAMCQAHAVRLSMSPARATGGNDHANSRHVRCCAGAPATDGVVDLLGHHIRDTRPIGIVPACDGSDAPKSCARSARHGCVSPFCKTTVSSRSRPSRHERRAGARTQEIGWTSPCEMRAWWMLAIDARTKCRSRRRQPCR